MAIEKKKNRLGEQVRKARKRHGMNQKELATELTKYKVDIYHTAMSKIEPGARVASNHELYTISKALNVTADSLLGTEREV